MFVHVFVQYIMQICQPFPGRNSVIAMDGASPHLKVQLRAECARIGVLCMFLPAYGYALNPTELAINAGRSTMRRKYGAAHVYANMNLCKVGDMFVECCYEAVTPQIACNMFIKAGIPVTQQERDTVENEVYIFCF